ncbi:hypothetical protein QBC39DRAFT_376363 [Podospora conica]|nr:hypothetical protein QBC39DRAFT_376363 [Schizothecium conicum]
MNANPLADREQALENQYIREKEQRMAKERAAAAKAAVAKDTPKSQDGQTTQEPK